MKRAVIAAGLFAFLSIFCWGQYFQLPPVENNINSITSAFESLLLNIARMGFIDYDSSWADNAERYRAYLDGVFENMTREKIRQYVSMINSRMNSIDFSDLSRRQQADFESFMARANVYSIFANFEINRRYDSPERQQQKLLLQPLWESLKNFQTWVLFFQNENSTVRDFLIAQDNKDGLYRILEEIPQRHFEVYEAKLNAFCTEWGL